jgi:hypothetical protein
MGKEERNEKDRNKGKKKERSGGTMTDTTLTKGKQRL